jgi:transposase
MRKAIDGLSLLVAGQMKLDPFSGHLFAFCNRRRTMVKLLLWDRNGFWLFQKRLEKQRFRWPKSEAEILEMEGRELGWLLEGLDPQGLVGHREEKYSTIY